MKKHEYERIQDFNVVTRMLHKVRYKNLEKVFSEIRQESNSTIHVLDIGCGACKAYEYLSPNFSINYTGIELNKDLAEIARSRYDSNKNFSIICNDVQDSFSIFKNFNVIIGLESFEHIPHSVVVRVVEAIGKSNFEYLYISVPNEIGPALAIKNIGSFLMGYERWKEYSWKETFFASIYNLDKVGVHTTRHKGFDWRWLAQTLRQNCKIERVHTSPFDFVPRFLSPSIHFVCKKR